MWPRSCPRRAGRREAALTGCDVFRVDRVRAGGAHGHIGPCGAVIEQHGPMIGRTPLHVVLEAGSSDLAQVEVNVGVHGIYRLSLQTDIIRGHHHTRAMWQSVGLGHTLMFARQTVTSWRPPPFRWSAFANAPRWRTMSANMLNYSTHSFSTRSRVAVRTLATQKGSSFQLTIREIVRTALLPA